MFESRGFVARMFCFACLVSCALVACSHETTEQARVPDSQFLAIDPGTASMMKAPGLCYFAQYFPDYRGISGVIFVGKVTKMLSDDDIAGFRQQYCFDGFTGCWSYPVVEIGIEAVLKGEAQIGATARLMIAPLRVDEAAKWYPDSRIVVFARRFKSDSNDALLTNVQATYFLKEGYALGTSDEALRFDFGESAVSEQTFVETVQRRLAENPDDCAWDEYAGLRKASEPSSEPGDNSGGTYGERM